LFKPGNPEPSSLCVLELPDGDYWVIDSPTGTYRAGHADRGKWRLVEQDYLARGYIREAEAKASGLIPSSWSRATPDPELSWQQRRRVWREVTLLVLLAVLIGMLAFVVW
jgi:hypothetical protein